MSFINELMFALNRPLQFLGGHSSRYSALKKKASSLAKDKNFYEQALQEISEYTKEGVETVKQRYADLKKQTDEMSFSQKEEEAILRFYRNDRHYIYELPLWNSQCGRPYLLSWIAKPYLERHHYRHILDFGSGAGDLGIALRQAGFHVTCFDINPSLVEFAKWRFQRRGLNIDFIDQSLKDGQLFDCIMAFDVFEHLKNLPEKIKRLRRNLHKGGSLIFNIEEGDGKDGLHLNENMIYRDAWQVHRMLTLAGFSFAWKFKRFYFYTASPENCELRKAV